MLKYARTPTALTLSLMLVQSFEAPLGIYFTSRLINSIGPYTDGLIALPEVIKWAALLLAAMLFAANSGLFTGLMEIYTQRALNKNLTKDVLEKFRRLDYICFEKPDVLNTIERMGTEPHMRLYTLYNNTVNAVSTLLSLAGTAVVFTQVSAWFAAVYFVLLAPLLWFDFKSIEARQRLWNTEMPNWRRRTYLSSLLADKHAMFELKLFSAVSFILSKWKRIADDFRRDYVRMRLKSSKYGVMHVLMLSAWAVFVILTMMFGLSDGTVSLGAFVACITSMGTILNHSSAMSAAFSQVSQDCLEMKHFDIFMSLEEVPSDNDSGAIVAPRIVFDDITFSYPGAKDPVLRGVSFEIRPGEKIALVGANGAGKSTIGRLLCGLYRPDSGNIYINGVSIHDISQTALRSVFSVVFQDFCGYELTLRENVAFGNISKLGDDAALQQALKDGLWTEDMPFDTNLGKLEQDGVDLSGGQWQKIAVARALASESSFIILDEPTAALDPLAECRMYETFQSILKNRGCVMISHRLASARLADKIIVLDGGKAAQSGTHDELMSRDGLYRDMWEAQSAWYVGGSDNG
jgi:ABC-type multidrug transport system fused ATPase/permease subunit